MIVSRVSVRSCSGFCSFAFALFLASCGGGGGGDGGGAVTTYTVGGTVSGLTGSVTLQNNGGDNLPVSANAAFTFATAIANTATYNVTVLTQPAGQTCSVSNGTGAISGANVTNVAVACFSILFRVIDHNGVGVSGADVYLDAGVAPVGATDVTGNMPLNLTGVHSVHFHKAGYFVASFVNRDWTLVGGTVTRGMFPYPGATTTGTVSGTISNTASGDAIRVQSRRSSDSFATAVVLPTATGPSTAYNHSSAPSGTNDLFVFPSSIGFPAGSSFIGYSPGIAVPSTVNPSLVRGAATSFSVTGAGGFPAGTISTRHRARADPLGLSENLFAVSSAPTAGATLAATTVNVPPLNLVYPNASYSLLVDAFSGPTGAGNYQVRRENHLFQTYADMVAAAASPQSFALTNDTLVATGPAHNATNVPVSPTFTWSRVGSPDFVEIRLYEYDPVRLFYAKSIWRANVYGNIFSVTPPATVALSANSFYAYEIYARRNLTNAGVFAGWQRNGWEDVKFSTGATTPP